MVSLAELRSRWRPQQYIHFDTACQRPKGKLLFSSAIMMITSYGCAPRYFRHLPAMSIKTTLHATAPLLYPCWRYPECPWGLSASPHPVAMAVVGWLLCPPPPLFFFGKKRFFPHTLLTPNKIFLRLTPKKISAEKKPRRLPNKKVTRFPPPPPPPQKKGELRLRLRLPLLSTIELCFPPFCWYL